MKNRFSSRTILIVSTLFFGVYLFLVLRHPAKNYVLSTGEARVGPSTQTNVSKPVFTNELHKSFQGHMNVPAVNPPHPANRQNAVGYKEQLLAEWQAPIDFYGRVVDESNNPVAAVGIEFNWNDTPDDKAGKKATTTSDANGLFELHGVRGEGLDVRVSKNGYYTSRKDTWSFTYAIGGHYTPDPWNPAVFHLRKKGTPEPLLRLAGAMVGPRQYRLDTKGAPTEISFYTGKRTPAEAAQLSVAYWMDIPKDRNQRQFNWRCQIAVPGGGLQATTDEYPFTAPEQGYQKAVEIESSTNAWSDRAAQTYYVHLSDGRYGLVKFNLICSANPFFGVEALVNLSGSKNLEYDKYLPGNIMVDQSAH